MSGYQTIIVALDVYSSTSPSVVEKAVSVASDPSKVKLVYVCYPFSYFGPYGRAYEAEVIEEIKQEAKNKLIDLAKQYNIPTANVFLQLGYPADEIHHFAQQQQADLIVIGTHGQSGVKLLLGSTANAVLHGVKCDVLAVKV